MYRPAKESTLPPGSGEMLGQGGVAYTSSCEASWLSGTVRDLQARDRRFDPRLR